MAVTVSLNPNAQSQKMHQQGICAAKRALAAGELNIFSGAPSATAWAADFAQTLRTRFGVEVIFHGDITTYDQVNFRRGFNSTIKEYIDSIHGAGAFKAVEAEVQVRRKQRYDSYFAGLGIDKPKSTGTSGED